jgi:hypothetical protein
MNAEFSHNGKLHSFEITHAEPPAFTITSSRACPKSPVMRYHLAYDHTDAERQVAVYVVVASFQQD